MKIKVGSFFKNVNPSQKKEAIEACYHIVGGKAGVSSGNAFLASLWYGWNYTGKETKVDNFHEISEGEFNAMTGGHPDWFVEIPNPFEEEVQTQGGTIKKEIIGGIMPDLTRPLCVIDLETTGVDSEKDRIVEICVHKIMTDGTEDTRTMLINPGIPIPKGASDVHGITDETVKGSPTFAQIAKALLAHIAGCDILGFNSTRFDVPFLVAEFERNGLHWDWRAVNLIDARNIFVQNEERTLTAGVKFYLGRDHTEAHSAEADVLETKNIFIAQLSKYPSIPRDFKDLALYSNFGKEIIDLAGKFAKNEAGDVVYTFGKHIGQPVKNHKDFLWWMINKADFPADTKKIANLLSL